MAVMREWSCLEHGEFEGSHAICPAFGCDSRAVKQEFRTPVGIRSGLTKRTDAGIRKSVDMYRLGNVRSARDGEASYGGDKGKELGMEVLWGNDVQRKMGRSFAEMTGVAQQPLIVPKRDGSGVLRLDKNNAMREAATELGITRRVTPPAAEVTSDKAISKEAAKALTV
jgi:hypothetical protein